MKGKPTELADSNSLEVTEFRPTVGEPTWYQRRPSACRQRLYSLDYLWDSWWWDQDLTLVHELALWSPFFTVDALFSLDAEWQGLIPASNEMSGFVDLPWEDLVFLSVCAGGSGRSEEEEKGRGNYC